MTYTWLSLSKVVFFDVCNVLGWI